MKNKTKKCKYCKAEIDAKAVICPNCGRKQKKSTGKKILIGIAALFVLFIAIGIFSDNDDTDVNPVDVQVSDTTAQNDSSGSADNSSAAIADTNVPTEYRSALNKAENYSDIMNMSKQGIYDQLTSEYGEKFSPEAAQYAIDNLNADYNENALKKAKTYSDTMHMSKQGIFDQLVSEYGEKFTQAEAQYAVDNLNADFNENALKKAETYQETMNMSPEAIRDQLVSEYGEKFTQSEADYAIANLQ